MYARFINVWIVDVYLVLTVCDGVCTSARSWSAVRRVGVGVLVD